MPAQRRVTHSVSPVVRDAHMSDDSVELGLTDAVQMYRRTLRRVQCDEAECTRVLPHIVSAIATGRVNVNERIVLHGGLYETTLLHVAASSIPLHALLLPLLQAGADVHATTSVGVTPLMLAADVACDASAHDAVHLLLQYGARTDARTRVKRRDATWHAQDRGNLRTLVLLNASSGVVQQ